MSRPGDGILSVVARPAAELFGIDEAKSHLNLAGDASQDGDIVSAIVGARQHIENITGRALVTQTFDWILPAFTDLFGLYWVSGVRYNGAAGCPAFVLPRPPLIEVVSIKYFDTDGAEQVVSAADYSVIAPRGDLAPFGQIDPAPSFSWPASRDQANGVTIRFTAGYGGPEQVPEPLRRAAKLILGDFFENREAQFVGVSAQTNLTLERLLHYYIAR